MKQQLTIQLVDTHAGGDVSRIVLGEDEYLRPCRWLEKALLEEPYGIPEMSVTC